SAHAPAAAPGSALTSFGIDGQVTRVYYLDASNQIIELGWNNGWFAGTAGADAHAPPAAPGSALTCFGVGQKATRVYYLDNTRQVIELAWEGRWVTNPAGANAKEANSFTPGAPPAATSSDLI